jgi:hypothetical protein
VPASVADAATVMDSDTDTDSVTASAPVSGSVVSGASGIA